MKYYKSENGVVSTIGTLNLPEITEAEYLAAMAQANENISANAPTPEPTAEERLDELEAAMIELAAIIGGAE